MQPIKWEIRINLQKRQSIACRGWIMSRWHEKNPLFRLGSKQAMHRAARETPATGD
jgi:hypothetical protein